MDIYKDGYIYTDVQTNRKMAIISFCKKYPCPQHHPFKYGEDVTGKWEKVFKWKELGRPSSDGHCGYIAVPIHTEQPTVKGVDVNGDEYPRLPLDAPTEQPSGIVLGKVERLNPDGSKTLISDGYSEQPNMQLLYEKIKRNYEALQSVNEQLVAHIEHLNQSDGWVRVEDGLPEVGDVDYGTKIMTYPHYINCNYGEFINARTGNKEIGFYSFDGEFDGDTKIHGVTHWRNRQPLPPPPKH